MPAHSPSYCDNHPESAAGNCDSTLASEQFSQQLPSHDSGRHVALSKTLRQSNQSKLSGGVRPGIPYELHHDAGGEPGIEARRPWLCQLGAEPAAC